jgi:hypothetical protein
MLSELQVLMRRAAGSVAARSRRTATFISAPSR